MNDLIIWSLVFIVSLAVLIKSSDYFTEAAEQIGIYLGISPFIIGVTIVSVGTSLPELISSIFAVLQDSSEVVAGNVIGSNITNIFLVLGTAAIAGKVIKISFELIHVDLPIFIGSALLLSLVIWDSCVTIPEAMLLMAVLILYITYTINSRKDYESSGKLDVENEPLKHRKLHKKTILFIIISPIFIYFGAKYTIGSIIMLSEILNIGKEIIAITAVALGTSLPELVVSIQAAHKGQPEIAVGNVLGSNIFNACAVMSIPAFIGQLKVEPSILEFGLPMMIIATVLYLFITQDRQITRWEGWLLIIFYVFFIGKIFYLI